MKYDEVYQRLIKNIETIENGAKRDKSREVNSYLDADLGEVKTLDNVQVEPQARCRSRTPQLVKNHGSGDDMGTE